MSFGKPCRDKGSKSLTVDDLDLFRGTLAEDQHKSSTNGPFG